MTRMRKDQANYFNRELSWLAFNERVLAQAEDENTPLLERCKFLAIVTSNLDEFFMIRVAGLKKQVSTGIGERSIDGRTPAEQLRDISRLCHEMVDRQYRCFNERIMPALKEAGIEIVNHEQLTVAERQRAGRHFDEVVYPVLTPMAIDTTHPFPTLVNNALYLVARMDPDVSKALRGSNLAVIQVPNVLGRFLELRDGDRVRLLPLEELIRLHMDELFAGHAVQAVHPFRLTRDTELDVDDDVSQDLLQAIEEQLTLLRQSSAVRLNVSSDVDEGLLAQLCEDLQLGEDDVYRIDGLPDMKGLWKVQSLEGFDHLRDAPISPVRPAVLKDRDDIFVAIRQQDIFLHHPYYSFDPVVEFARSAAADPNVMAIKQTLYRTSGESPVIAALKRAAMAGKHVTVLVELRARLDEERNIRWARELEKAGADVIYGVMGLKTHCKALLVVRRESDGVRRYVHVATGNYNDATARVYTDIGILSARRELAEDVSALFNVITGYSIPPRWNLIEMAPTGLRRRLLHLIRREIKQHSDVTPGFIRAKLNSINDKPIIDALYEASSAGVKVDLLVRGICCLRPGVKGLSENIRVRSIVGRFLEHSRIFHFHNGGKEEVYIASADWMNRNMDRRIETAIPIVDERVKRLVLEVLDSGLADNVKSWELHSDGSYTRYQNGRKPHNSQEDLCRVAGKAAVRAPRRRSTGMQTTIQPNRKPPGPEPDHAEEVR